MTGKETACWLSLAPYVSLTTPGRERERESLRLSCETVRLLHFVTERSFKRLWSISAHKRWWSSSWSVVVTALKKQPAFNRQRQQRPQRQQRQQRSRDEHFSKTFLMTSIFRSEILKGPVLCGLVHDPHGSNLTVIVDGNRCVTEPSSKGPLGPPLAIAARTGRLEACHAALNTTVGN